jgi:hypothetical protein
MVGGLNWLFQKEIRKLDLTSHGTMEALSEFRFSKEVVISKLILLFGNFSKWPFSINGKSGTIHTLVVGQKRNLVNYFFC